MKDCERQERSKDRAGCALIPIKSHVGASMSTKKQSRRPGAFSDGVHLIQRAYWQRQGSSEATKNRFSGGFLRRRESSSRNCRLNGRNQYGT
jgi:hypothetical protein